MRKRTHLATAAVLALTFATSPTAAANDFRGAWPDVKPSEFTLVQLVDDGYAYGYRSSRELPHLIFDLEHTDRLKFQTMDIQLGFWRSSNDTSDQAVHAPKVVPLPGDE